MTMQAAAKRPKIQSAIKTITPVVARAYLKTNKKNRRFNAPRIARLARAMTNGEWVIAQPLMLNCDGTLIDGQHRCRAVIEANMPVDFLVLSGFDAEGTFAKLDDVDPRRLAHWLDIQGEARAPVLAVVVRMAYLASLGNNPYQYTGRVILTGPMGVEFLAKHPELRQAVNDGPGIHNNYTSPAVCAYLYSLFVQSDKRKANRFFIDLIADDYAGEGDPIYLLRERLKNNRRAKEKLKRVEMAALFVKAWNAYKADRPLKQLKWLSTGEKREKFPTVE